MGRLSRTRALAEGTSGQIVNLLRHRPMTIDELAEALGVTRSAIRPHLAALQHKGAIEEHGLRRGLSKPARLYAVTAETELLLSHAYIPIFTQLLHTLAARMSRSELDAALRDAGRRVIAGSDMPRGSVRDRVVAGSALLNELGGLTEVTEEPEHYLIKGYSCPLAAVTADHPEACNSLESLLAEFIGVPVAKCCERSERLRCCFQIDRAGSAGNAVGPMPVATGW